MLENSLVWQPPFQEIYLRGAEGPAESVRSPVNEARAGGAAAEDVALAEACRSGSLAAYERLYQLHGARLKSLAVNLLGNAQDAEDVVQEVFLKIYRSIRYFKGQSAFSTWIYRILLNSCYDVRRRRQRRPEVRESEREPEMSPEPPAPISDHPLRLALERGIALLAPRHREVFLLFQVEGFRHSEIAVMLNISEAASKMVLYQAKQQLRRWFRETSQQKG